MLTLPSFPAENTLPRTMLMMAGTSLLFAAGMRLSGMHNDEDLVASLKGSAAVAGLAVLLAVAA